MKIYQKRALALSDDGDGNENVKENNRFVKQNYNFVRASYVFVHFLTSLHDYDVKCLISRFMEDVNKR